MQPEWAAPASVGALMSTREGGVSAAPWDSLNLGVAVGDDPAAVAENRRRFARALGAEPVWLRQVHGARVVRAGTDTDLVADAAWTDARGIACVVQVADCLPVLLARRDGAAVAAAHAGWRGLAGGVLEATVQALCAGTGCLPAELVAWLGPCIGPGRFEVGADVLAAFPQAPDRFVFRPRPDGAERWLADLPGLARDRLQAAGVSAIAGGGWCTVEDRTRFFSFRRDGTTGRMAAAVWRR
ncbi:MAG: peptidoglycan editing factor PgeF [Rubrivivax sp.]